MKLFTLIHVSQNKKHQTEELKDRVLPYLLCAIQLHQSLKRAGILLSVITNDKNYLLKLMSFNFTLDFVELDFTLEVPEDVKFYSAHYKIETYKYLSTLNEEYVGLIDCDVTCINKINTALQNIIDQKLPLYYDITDQMVPAFGLERIIKDKQKISGKPSIGLWAGGEFFSGTPSFFAELYKSIDLIKEVYFKHYKSLFHEGDEMLTSIAIENMLAGGKPVYDAGNLGVITRYWSINTRHHQKSFNAYKECLLLHLPADKEFLSRIAQNSGANDTLQKYIKHLWIIKPRQIASKIFRYLKSK
jgi:hypothetical protein